MFLGSFIFSENTLDEFKNNRVIVYCYDGDSDDDQYKVKDINLDVKKKTSLRMNLN